jgi:hypothetical protein
LGAAATAAATAAAAAAAADAAGGQGQAQAQAHERLLKAVLGELLEEYEVFRTGPSAASAVEVDVRDDGIQYQLL